jgi:hypothetical protein
MSTKVDARRKAAMTGEDPMHADDDRVVRCDYYQEEVRK